MAKGFTIIEMLVIIGVLTVLSGLLILYSRTGELTSVLLRESAKIASNLNRVKNMSLTTTEFVDQQGKTIKPCGYGVFFDKTNNQYIIFADSNQNCQTSNHLRPVDGSSDVETIALTLPLVIDFTTIDQVFFLPPDPTVFFEPQTITEAEIGIKAPNGATMRVKINKTGQVSTF